jgi:hypothetical protein
MPRIKASLFVQKEDGRKKEGWDCSWNMSEINLETIFLHDAKATRKWESV